MKNFAMLCLIAAMITVEALGLTLKTELKKVYEIGSGDLILGDVPNLAQDREGNLYVPDIKAFKIHKFSPTGKLLLSFGQRGEGPGDFRRLHSVAISENNELMVGGWSSLSVFDTEGKLKKKYNLSRLGYIFNIKYVGGNNILYIRLVDRNSPPPLNLAQVAPEVKILTKPFLTCSKPPMYKEIALFNKAYAPEIYYSYSNGYAAAALSEKYLVKIIVEDGKAVHTIERDVPKPELSKKERDYLIETDVNQWKELKKYSQSVSEKLKRLIPHKKCFIGGIAVSGEYVFVERIKDDITDEEAPVPVDVFSIKGKFLGQVKLRLFPALVTEKFMYFVERNEEDDLLVTKYTFSMRSR
jgi:hypothetical protein